MAAHQQPNPPPFDGVCLTGCSGMAALVTHGSSARDYERESQQAAAMSSRHVLENPYFQCIVVTCAQAGHVGSMLHENSNASNMSVASQPHTPAGGDAARVDAERRVALVEEKPAQPRPRFARRRVRERRMKRTYRCSVLALYAPDGTTNGMREEERPYVRPFAGVEVCRGGTK
jgi:hypothetical protein